MRIPKKLKIGYHDYEVIEWTAFEVDLSGTWGQCDKNEKKIYVCTETNSKSVADIFLHECMHAIWEYFNLDEEESEENAISRLSSGLIALFVDNPKTLEWLTERINNET